MLFIVSKYLVLWRDDLPTTLHRVVTLSQACKKNRRQQHPLCCCHCHWGKTTQLIRHQIHLNVLHYCPNHHACPFSKCFTILCVYVVSSPPSYLIVPTTLGWFGWICKQIFYTPIQLKWLKIPSSIMPIHLHHLIHFGNHSGNQSFHFPVVTLHGGALEVRSDKAFQR